MSQGERGQQGDHGQQGDQGDHGLTGDTGAKGSRGPRGERGPTGETPGGVLRMTDRRVLVMFVAVVAAFTLLAARSEHQANDIKQNNYTTCRGFAALIVAQNENNRPLALPDCERLKP